MKLYRLPSTSFLGSDVDVETRCIVHRVNIHMLICTLNVRETSDDFCRVCP